MRATGAVSRQRRSLAANAYTEQDLEVGGDPQARGTQPCNGRKVTVLGDEDAAL